MNSGTIKPGARLGLIIVLLPWFVIFILYMIFHGGKANADRLTEEDITVQSAQQVTASTVKLEPSFGDIGSGFFISPDTILTNYHVIERADEVRVTRSDGRLVEGKVGYREEGWDLALVIVDVPNDRYLSFDAQKPQVGQTVLAVGNPRYFDFTLTKGIVSADRGDFVQFDSHIKKGNSGGPLVNLQGNVIGVITAKAKEEEYIGYATAAEGVKHFLERANAELNARK